MSCTICGRTTLPGAKLCLQCKKALKRARQQTVSELEPRRQPPAPSGRREDNRGAPEIRSLRVRLGGRGFASRLGLPASLVALGVVVVATGYFVSHLRGAGSLPEAPASEQTPSQQALTGGAYVPLPVMPLPQREATPAEGGVPVLLHDTVPLGTPAVKPTVPRQAKAARPRDAPPAAEPPIAAAQPVDPAPPPQPEAAPVAPAPDRWQLLAEAIARCAGEGGLAGVICEQRARWQYCEGYWGRVTQCPGAMTSEYAR